MSEQAPCTCIRATRERPPILDPFCPGVAAHREAAVQDWEPVYKAPGK